MLFADKAALENRTKVRLLTIRERELTLYTQNCHTVGTVATLMAGISHSSIIYTKLGYFQNSSTLVQTLYMTGTCICMGLSLRNVLGTTMISMLGPGKALRGPDGSMHSAVDGMLEAFSGISRVQRGIVYSFMVTSMTLVWGAISSSWAESVLLTALLIFLTCIMHLQIDNVERAFPLDNIALVSGAFFAHAGAPLHETAQTQPQPRAPIRGSQTTIGLPSEVALPPPPPLAGGLDRIKKQQLIEQHMQAAARRRRQINAPPPPSPSSRSGYQEVPQGVPSGIPEEMM